MLSENRRGGNELLRGQWRSMPDKYRTEKTLQTTKAIGNRSIIRWNKLRSILSIGIKNTFCAEMTVFEYVWMIP
jgi:hypothetical protein